MRVSLKVLGLLWLGLFIIIGVLLFNAYSKLKPDTFIALITEQVQKNYPGSKLNVGKISYRFSLDFNLNLRDIHLRRSDKLLASIGEVELIVPWWLLLSNHGNAQINLKNLDIFVDHNPAEASPVSSIIVPSEKIKVELPGYLTDANFTLRAKQIAIRDIHNARRYFNVSKLLVREFQYGKNSAFEINIPVMIRHKDTEYASDLWLFGDVTPETSAWSLNYRGEFRTREANDKFQVEDIIIGGKANFIPSKLEVTSDLKLEVDKRIIGTGSFSADQELLNLNLNFTKFPLGYFSFINEEIKNPYMKNPQGEATGQLTFKRSFDSSLAQFSGKMNFDGLFSLTEKENIAGSWQVNFQDTKWEISFLSPKGETSFFRRYVVDLKSGEISQYFEEIGFNGLDLASAITPVVSLHKFIKETPSSYYTTSIVYKRCTLGDEVVDGQFRYGLTPNQRFYTGELTTSKGELKIKYGGKAESNSFDLNAKSFPFNKAYQFLAPLFTTSEGLLSGKVEGRWSDNWETGQWLVQLNGTQFSETEGRVPELIARTSSFFNLNSKTYPSQSLNLSGKNGVFTLNSLMLEALESVKITGTLSSKQKSFLTLSYPKNKKFKPLKKEVIEPYWMQKEEL